MRRAVYRGRGPVWTQGDAQDVGRLRGLNRVALWTSENARKELFFCERRVSKQPLAIKDSNALTICFKWIFVLKAFVVHSCEKRLDATGFKGQRTRGCCFMSRSQHYKCTLKNIRLQLYWTPLTLVLYIFQNISFCFPKEESDFNAFTFFNNENLKKLRFTTLTVETHHHSL